VEKLLDEGFQRLPRKLIILQ